MEFPNTNKAIMDFCIAYTTEWKDKIDIKYPNSPLGNMTYTIKEKNLNYTIKIKVADYFWYWHDGRRPGKMPPLQPIENWIKKYNIIPRPLTLKNGKTTIPSQKSLAFLIARSIGRNGTKGVKLWDDFHDKFVEKWTDIITEAVQKDIIESLEAELQ